MSITLATDDVTAAALVQTIKHAVNGNGKYDAYLTDHTVDRANIKHHAAALAALAYPNEKPVQKKDGMRTKYGNAVQAAANGLRAAIARTEADGEPDAAVTHLLTKAGLSSSLDDVIAEWNKANQDNSGTDGE